MAKRLAALVFAALLTAGFVFAQELEISGEMKTGFFWEQWFDDGTEIYEEAEMHNNDDAGEKQGRFRMDMHLHTENNMGMKVRFQQQVWTQAQPSQWAYAMAYGNFLDEQLRVTIGRLGLSPWGADSTDLLKDELDNTLGIRTEIMPGFLPGLDIGFVLNGYNSGDYNGETKGVVNTNRLVSGNKLADMLLETVLGVAYTNDYFQGNIAVRLDGQEDGSTKVLQDGIEMVYRLEERIIRQSLEGFSIWAAGYLRGIGEKSGVNDEYNALFQNYLYIDYSPEAFSARLSGGLQTEKDVQTFNGRVHFYYNILPVLSAGTAFKYGQQFGKPKYGADKATWGIEPQVRVTFNPNAYIALVYNYGQEYVFDQQKNPVVDEETGKQVFSDKVQWLNLRVVYTF